LIFGPGEVGIDAFFCGGRLLRGRKDANQFARVWNTQGMQPKIIDEAKDGRACADAESKGKDGGEGKTGRPP